MQADEFEKKIKDKMEGFELVPDNEVWKQVSDKIEKAKKRRRIFLYWLFTGFVLLAGIPTWWLINNDNNKQLVINEVNNNTSKGEDYRIKQNTDNSLKSRNKIQKIHSLKSIEYFKRNDIKRLKQTEIINNAISKIASAKVINQTPVASQKKEYNKTYNEEKKYTQQALAPHRFYNPAATTAKMDTLIKNKDNSGKTNFIKNTSVNAPGKKPIDKKLIVSKKWQLGFTVYSGISENLSGFPLVQKNYAQNYSSSPTVLPGGNYSYSANTIKNFSSSFSFGLGIFLKRKLSKKLTVSAGADYHLYSVKSAVGSKVTQQRTFYDSLLEKTTSVNGYYTIGNSTRYSNKYQLAELPVSLEYRINKNPAKPLLISAGISPGYLVSSNALYANSSANVYYANKQQFHYFQLAAQIGFSFPITVSSKYLINAGPVAQYGLTSIAKEAAGANQHLFFAGIKAKIILK